VVSPRNSITASPTFIGMRLLLLLDQPWCSTHTAEEFGVAYATRRFLAIRVCRSTLLADSTSALVHDEHEHFLREFFIHYPRRNFVIVQYQLIHTTDAKI
jgi:hypothetical protein